MLCCYQCVSVIHRFVDDDFVSQKSHILTFQRKADVFLRTSQTMILLLFSK